MSTRTVNTEHGQSVILSLQKADVSSCSAWACGMLTKELLQNLMMKVTSRDDRGERGEKDIQGDTSDLHTDPEYPYLGISAWNGYILPNDVKSEYSEPKSGIITHLVIFCVMA